MSKRSWLTRLLVGGLLAGGLMIGLSPPAQAGDCIYVKAYITREDDTPIPLWDGCVYPTNWNATIDNGASPGASNVVPGGMPNGAFVWVSVPAP